MKYVISVLAVMAFVIMLSDLVYEQKPAALAQLVLPPDAPSSQSIMLILQVIMPEYAPDRFRKMSEPTIEKCWEDAKAFIEQGLTEGMIKSGAVGVGAGCQKMGKDEHL